MLFNSFDFAVFFPIVFFLYWAVPQKYRWPLLLVTSYYFYMSWNAKYLVLILLTTAVSYFAARLLERTEKEKEKKLVVFGTLIVCLGVLFVFKYFNFVSSSLAALSNIFLRGGVQPVTLNLLLPVGISFYTFQTLSYVIDVYRGTMKAEHNFGVYATFVSFFPQLVAGPIERSQNLLPQITSRKTFCYADCTYGLKLMAWGFFKKIAIADVLAGYVDAVYQSTDVLFGFDYAMAVLFFTIQIYCDFSGYSDIAIGAAKMLGIDLMRNFNSPYFSKSIKEFWSRWHISLSTWFKDYLYIPMGGNRCSKLRNSFNLFVTFLISGLWHGASWNFVIWGGIHGLLQVVERSCDSPLRKFRNKNRLSGVLAALAVFVVCNITWVFFRAESIPEAIHVLVRAVYGIWSPSTYFHSCIGLNPLNLVKIFITVLILAVYDFYSLRVDVIQWISGQRWIVRWSVYLAMILLIIANAPLSNQTAFIYFQF